MNNYKKCKKDNFKCGFCRKEGHQFNQCTESKIYDITRLCNNEINESIINNIDLYLMIIEYMDSSLHSINFKYLYLNPLLDYIKRNIEKIIKKRNIIEKKVISRYYNLPTSFPQSELIFQLTDTYFEIFREEFKKKQEFINILYQEFPFDNLTFYINKLKKYNKLDIILMIIFLVKNQDMNAEEIIDYFYKIYNNNKINQIIIEELDDLNNHYLNNNDFLEGIHSAIEYLIKLNYEFEKESIYYINNNIIEELKFNINKEINSETYECPICLDEIKDKSLIITNCSHIMCYNCFTKLKENRLPYRKTCCAICRTNITKIKIYHK